MQGSSWWSEEAWADQPTLSSKSIPIPGMEYRAWIKHSAIALPSPKLTLSDQGGEFILINLKSRIYRWLLMPGDGICWSSMLLRSQWQDRSVLLRPHRRLLQEVYSKTLRGVSGTSSLFNRNTEVSKKDFASDLSSND